MKKILLLGLLLFSISAFSQVTEGGYNFIGITPQLGIYGGDIHNTTAKGGIGIQYMHDFAEGNWDIRGALNYVPLAATDKDFSTDAGNVYNRPAPFTNNLATASAYLTYSPLSLQYYWWTPIVYTGATAIHHRYDNSLAFGLPVGAGLRYSPKIRADLIFELAAEYTQLFKDNIDNYTWSYTHNKDHYVGLKFSVYCMIGDRWTYKGHRR